MSAVAGIFVGGRAERMGGLAKGLLEVPTGGRIVQRLRDAITAAGLEIVLVGKDDRYASLGLPAIDDDPPGVGPLGGLIALLHHAGNRPAVAIACDMPFVDAPLLGRLVAAPDAAVIAPRQGTRWEPLFARYDSQRVLPAAKTRASQRQHSLQGLLDAVAARELPLTDAEWRQLRDWDTPADRMK